MRNLKYIFIHCTASPEGHDYTSLQIAGWWKGRGWTNPGYHYVIHLDGRIEQLLGVQYVSNGVKGYNHKSINIAYIGGTRMAPAMKNGQPLLNADGGQMRTPVPADTRTDAQKDALRNLVAQLHQQYASGQWGNPPCTLQQARQHLLVRGHYEVAAKACPCFDVKELKTL
ncbi:MAG: N-acetylmuramoyl-L-alanine amidase [Bacteroidales bacterium]|nr:N-acetylmuramoyl-L-alanine amidase [Candidatus Minthousia equi]